MTGSSGIQRLYLQQTCWGLEPKTKESVWTCRVLPRPMQWARIQPEPWEELAVLTDSQQLSQINWTPVIHNTHTERHTETWMTHCFTRASLESFLKVSTQREDGVGWGGRGLTVHLVRLQSCHQVIVDLNKRLLGHWILIQHQLGSDGTCNLRQFVLYNNDLQTKVVGFEMQHFDLPTVKNDCYVS